MGDFKPLDLPKFKGIVRHESARMGLGSYSMEGESSFTLALALSAAVKKIFFEKSETTFSGEPLLSKKAITQFAHRMRVDAMEKFNATTVCAAVHFAASQEDLDRQEYMLMLVVYLEQRFLPEFLRMLQYPYIDFDEVDEVKDGCGTLANLIAGQYKREMIQLGYKDLMMSHFESFINAAPDGLGIPKGLTDKYEISFEVEGTKRLVVELVTLDMLPKWKAVEKAAPKKLLIIDDDVTFIKIIEPFLKSQGFDVIVAYNGAEGIKRLGMKPQLIVLDIQMPVMDGYEFILEKKKIREAVDVPVIVLTAREGMAEMFRIEGAREYLLKPFQPAALLKSIQRCL
ncbi:MAG: response regulator [Candidatus Omnitrophica bacterium]|nr:response regulator [Candidatus Omnitrophota bacterium]MDE2010404.1 response regulator [Candidatus Omnitrophota bacterium]MDE2214759.1 response regulator [Candidatus Omnitrophota bacterium]MDE2231458.1 response regulator [Candidatus Omnitrophota bacterium]